ncbi:olfactory receptor 7D4-like [Marmota monax]|uniref:olfactory receptor 7D4-like n=1 Tax=Marmota monax TaxID=9995 RepID=UPI001EB09F9D|nr:olfactory receptor 7D4-like [Marmota monax]
MYFFLSNLSLADICFTSTIIPQMPVNIHTQSKEISYLEFLTQVYFFMIFVGMDNMLLTVMAYDCFVAICHPLKYTVIMNPWLCVLLVLMSWNIMFWFSLFHILLLKQFTFSMGTEIPPFFCDVPQPFKVANSDALIMYVSTALMVVFPVAGILYSYSQIVSSLLRMSSSVSKSKAFSSCGSHLCVVSLLYEAGLVEYLNSSGTHSSQRTTIASVMYTVVTPMLNPLIYSLRNKDVKGALGRLLRRAACCP